MLANSSPPRVYEIIERIRKQTEHNLGQHNHSLGSGVLGVSLRPKAQPPHEGGEEAEAEP